MRIPKVSHEAFDLALLGSRPSTRFQKGFTILEVLVAIAIGLIAMMGVVSMFETSFKMQRHLAQKYAVLDLGSAIRHSMSQANFCACNFQSPMDLSSSEISVSTMNTVPVSACAPVTGILISSVAPNDYVADKTLGLKVKKMQMQNIRLLNSVSPTSNRYSFDIQVEFDPATMAMPIKPLLVSSIIATTAVGAPSSETIQSCSIAGVSGGVSLTPEENCTSLGGTYKAPSGPCTFPSSVASPSATCVSLGGTYKEPSGPCSIPPGGIGPQGPVVAECHWSVAGTNRSEGCTGGASFPNVCPTGSSISEYNVSGPGTSAESGNFNCRTK